MRSSTDNDPASRCLAAQKTGKQQKNETQEEKALETWSKFEKIPNTQKGEAHLPDVHRDSISGVRMVYGAWDRLSDWWLRMCRLKFIKCKTPLSKSCVWKLQTPDPPKLISPIT